MVEWIECKISDIGTVGGATPLREVLENYGLLPINSYH